MSEYALVDFVAGLNCIAYRYETINVNRMLYIKRQNNTFDEIGTWKQLADDMRSKGNAKVFSPYYGYLGDIGTLHGKVYLKL